MALKPDSPNSKRKFRRPKGAVGIAPDYPEFAKVRTPTIPQQKTKSSIKAGRIPSPPRPQPKKKKTKTRTWKGWFLSSLFEYSLLYSLYVYIWTCPKDGSDDRTICDLGDRTLDIVEPYMYDVYDFYIEPYYDEYLASYVNKAAPYIISANEQYVRPARVYAVEQFEKTGRPLLVKAKDAAVATLSPYAQRAYDAYLAEFVATGREAYDAYAPTVEKYGKQGYDYAIEKAYPYYLISLPYLEKAWEQGIETAGWAGVEGKGWISRRWGIHVEPQLWRIQERLGLKGLRGTRVQDGPTPPHRGNPNASDTAPENILEESYEDIDAKETPQANAQGATGEEKEKKKSSAEQIEAARPQVEADLESWGAKFEEAGVKASADVVSQLDELCGKVMKEHGTLSTEILTDLEARIEKEYRDFEQGLGTLLDSPAETKYVMVGYDGLVGRTMQNLKEKQTQIKGRTQELLMDTYQTTAKIVDAALAEMDSAHDIGMQELGMKWAWMEGVTYKDWAKYHDLKKAFGSLKTKVIRSGQGHKGLREVTDYAKSIDDAAADVLKVARVEVGKLEKLGRQRLVKACAERDAAEAEKEAAGKSDKQTVGDVERDEKGEVVKEVPPSDATKEAKARQSQNANRKPNPKASRPPPSKNGLPPKKRPNPNQRPNPKNQPSPPQKRPATKPKAGTPQKKPNPNPNPKPKPKAQLNQKPRPPPNPNPNQKPRPNPNQKPVQSQRPPKQNPNQPVKKKNPNPNVKPKRVPVQNPNKIKNPNPSRSQRPIPNKSQPPKRPKPRPIPAQDPPLKNPL
ncbi:hypothetical protein EYR41_006259 [Orbilia oligospora]|uniref:Uncharacterized protein n=1 Tax=Orbilia oligospora TaxID=2813651 RepID=A0A8H2E6G3_ORBOL|nr:hypothetical protein EYR41_006259 [Orbilia oligospora]